MKSKKITAAIIAAISLVALSVGLTACNKANPGYSGVESQADILFELNSMTADAGILDYTMASYLLSQDTELTKNLQIVETIALPIENYGIAFRKGSTGLCDKINSALAALKSTKVAEIADKYGLKDNVLALNYTAPTEPVDNTDWNYIVNKGTFIVGYTQNAPMAMKNGDELSGFDIDLPIAVVDYLNETYNTNIKIKFVEINWVLKETELSSKAIDCVWNGMTITDERLEAMTVSMPYLINKQCVLIRKSDADKYKTLEDLKNARVVAEQGSAGETIAEGLFKTSDEDEE